MKKIYFLSLILFSSLSLTAQFTVTSYRGAFAPGTPMWTDSWTNYDPNSTTYPATTVTVNADITVNTTWTANNVYNLSGQIFVTNGATLTIQPGTVIRGDVDPLLKSALVISRGSKIIAEGTATNPIIFTSGKAAGSRAPGDWGGLVLLGRGLYNVNNGWANVEGFAPASSTDYRMRFGADATLGEVANNADNSGSLKYVRIEFGGVLLSANNEINGLTLGAVGSGTTIDYVQCSFINDDSFEWFGGAVNCKHLIAYRGVDDDFDTDNGFSGKVQFCLAVKDPLLFDPTFGAPSGSSTSEGFESDNNSAGGIETPLTSALFSNITMVGPSYRSTLAGTTLSASHKRAARIRRNSALKICNSIFLDFVEGLHIDNTGSAPNGASEANVANGSLVFKNNILAGITTASKIAFINTTGNHPTPALDIPTWFTTQSNNTGLATPIPSTGILTRPYDTVGTVYTGLDYRPATNSIASTGASFTDAAFTGLLQTTYYVDVDGDGYDSGTAVLTASVPPAGYSLTTLGSDCDDTNATIFTNCPTIIPVSYRGAFAQAPIPMWTDSWTNYDPNSTTYPATTVTVNADITVNTTWTANNVYNLSGQIFVTNGATLTIQPGTVIRGDVDPLLKSALVISRGSKIIAEGTATNPIIFTSGKAAGSRAPGDWGGLVLLGRGLYNVNNGWANVEGFAPASSTDYRMRFGADATLGEVANNADNSGSLKYVRIEFGGVLLSANNEINGLTLGAVGSGTTIDYVQCSFINDDSFEWFGGAVNCKHLIAYRGVDDDFDTDNGFSGKVQFCLAVKDPLLFDPTFGAPSGSSTSEGFESDNNSAGGIETPLTSALFSNITMVGPSYRSTLAGTTLSASHKRAARIRRNSALKICNSIFLDFVEGLHIDNTGSAPNGASEANVANGSLVFKNNILAGITTASKIAFINTTGNHPTPALDIPTWFTTQSNNTGLATPIPSTGILTRPYDTVGTVYTGLDYRPATNSIASTGASYTDAAFTGLTGTISTDINLMDNASLKSYPNPFNTSFRLSFESTSTDEVSVNAYDLTGRLMESHKMNYNDVNNQEFGSNYQSGMYIIVLKQGEISKSYQVIKK